MARSMNITFDPKLYDEGAVEETVETFKQVADITLGSGRSGIMVTVKAPASEVEAIAGALANIALARTIEVRS
ncbi:MAG: hypothetical protein JRG91_03195 [Deltaproteobacteria bacterium]|nr:hypothetical protein [Deltaproteobacteria bacterium]